MVVGMVDRLARVEEIREVRLLSLRLIIFRVGGVSNHTTPQPYTLIISVLVFFNILCIYRPSILLKLGLRLN
jgi:hypothetical protein